MLKYLKLIISIYLKITLKFNFHKFIKLIQFLILSILNFNISLYIYTILIVIISFIINQPNKQNFKIVDVKFVSKKKILKDYHLIVVHYLYNHLNIQCALQTELFLSLWILYHGYKSKFHIYLIDKFLFNYYINII